MFLSFLAKEWKAILIFLMVIVVGCWGYGEYQILRAHYLKPAIPTVIVQPLQETVKVVNTTSAAVVPVAQPGQVVQFVDRGGQIVAVVNGKEYIVPNQTGSSNVELGKNGQLQLTTQAVAKIDMTDIVNQRLNESLAADRAIWQKAEGDQKWELGVGVGYHKEAYIPISVQYNPTHHTGIMAEIHLAGSGIDGGEAQYKIRF